MMGGANPVQGTTVQRHLNQALARLARPGFARGVAQMGTKRFRRGARTPQGTVSRVIVFQPAQSRAGKTRTRMMMAVHVVMVTLALAGMLQQPEKVKEKTMFSGEQVAPNCWK